MEYWPLPAIISTNDRKEKSLAGVTAPWTGEAVVPTEKKKALAGCLPMLRGRKSTNILLQRSPYACISEGGFFNDGPVMEGGSRMAPVSHFSPQAKVQLVSKGEALKSTRIVHIQPCGLSALQRQLTRLMVLYALSPFSKE